MGKHLISHLEGNVFGWFASWFYQREYRIIVVGLDGAGKTTIMRLLQTGKITTTVPSNHPTYVLAIGFNVDSFNIDQFKVEMWDLGGQSSIRAYWRCYLANTDGIVFVVDSADPERFIIGKAELMALLKEPEIEGVPVLILSNKSDAEGARSAVQVSKALDLASISKRPWSIHQSSAKSGQGIKEGIKW